MGKVKFRIVASPPTTANKANDGKTENNPTMSCHSFSISIVWPTGLVSVFVSGYMDIWTRTDTRTGLHLS